MRVLPLLAALALSLPWAAQALGARPDPALDCTAFTTVQPVDGRVLEIRGFVCQTPGKPPKVEITDRREAEPARELKRRLIW